MNDPGAFVTQPFLSLEQCHVANPELLDGSRISRFGCRIAQAPTLHAALLKPFATCAGVGGNQPQRYMIDVKARAHGLVQHAQAEANAPRIDQAAERPHQPGHVGGETSMAGKVPIGRRQGWQLQLTVAGRFEGQRFRQRLAQGQESVGELGNVQRQLALPYAEVDAIVQRFAEYCRGCRPAAGAAMGG